MAILGVPDVFIFCFCLAIHFGYRYSRKPLLPTAPGPRKWPLIGHALSVPMKHGHIVYKELGKKLGSKIMYLEALGMSIVVLNDAQMARDLLEKRSALYSSRPHLPMFIDVLKITHLLGIMPYGEEWRNHRRLFQQYFSPKALPREQEKTLEFVRKALLPNLYQSPQNFHEHIRNCVGGFIIATTYGLRIRRHDDPFINLSEGAFAAASMAGSPGRFLVDLIPALKHVPEWMPGAEFKRLARKWRDLLIRVMEEPYQAALKAMEDGTAQVSFVSDSLERHSNRPDSELQALHIKQMATQVYGAGSETTVAASLTFILAMLKHPDIQRKAQQEIDSVVGRNRLPDYSDKPNLPYLSAVLREVLRWNPLLPIGIPHLTTEEDTYLGYYIPKGSMVIANAYAMLHDEEFFPNPSEFQPDRFFKNGKMPTDIPDPEVFATFGFGRRICPGAHIGLSTLYLICASILTLFDISPDIDAEGKPIEVIPEFVAASIVSEPMPFRCKLTPRQGKDVEKLLKEYLSVEII